MAKTSQVSGLDLDKASEDYSKLRQDYEDFTSRLERLVQELIVKSKIDLHAVQSRAKSVESFRKK